MVNYFVSKQKLLHIWFRGTLLELVMGGKFHILFSGTLSDFAMGNSSKLSRKITFKQRSARDQSLTQQRLPNI